MDTAEGVSGGGIHQVRRRWYNSCVEVPLFLFFFVYALSEIVIRNLILYKTCTVTYKYNETICSAVIDSNWTNETKEIEDTLQRYSSTVIMYQQLAESIFPAIMSLFLGPWSDKNGRKPLLVSAMFGYSTYFIMTIIYTSIPNLDPMYWIISGIPFSMIGGVASIITGSFCYVSDITDGTNRSFRMSILEGALMLGIFCGAVCSSYVVRFAGYSGVLILCAVLTIASMFHCLFILIESVSPQTLNVRYSKFFDCTLISKMVDACFRNRSTHKQVLIWLMMLASSFSIFIMQGEITILYLFMRERLDWNLQSYSVFTAFNIGTAVLGTLIVAFVFQKCFNVKDAIMSFLSYLSSAGRSLAFLFIDKSWQMYLCSGLSCLRAVSSPINRAILTKIVSAKDVGKIMSLTTSLESIIPLAAYVLYPYIYKNTLSTFPGAFNIVSLVLYGVCLILLGLVHYILTKYEKNDENDERPIIENQQDN